MKESTQPQKLAISYIRYSSNKQEQGDSYNRQYKQTEDFCRENNFKLISDKAYEDLGVSGFRGKNADEGALKNLLDNVASGKIPNNTYLIIESLDRLGRQRIRKAMTVFLNILAGGINIVTLGDEQTIYYHDDHPSSKNSDSMGQMMEILISLTVMARARGESALKSNRVRKAHNARLKKAEENPNEVINRNFPSWVTLKDGEKVIIPDRAKLIQRIFEMSLEIGNVTIARILNEEDVPTLGKSSMWRIATLQKILTSPSAYGLYQSRTKDEDGEWINNGEPISNYFPAIITKELYGRVQGKRVARSNSGSGGRGANTYQNILGKVMRCSCGAKMYHHKTKKLNASYEYLYCTDKCGAKAINYKFIEDSVIGNLPSLDWQALVEGKVTARDGQIRDNELIQVKIEELKVALVDLKREWRVKKSPTLLLLMRETDEEIEELEGQVIMPKPMTESDEKDLFNSFAHMLVDRYKGLKIRKSLSEAIQDSIKTITTLVINKDNFAMSIQPKFGDETFIAFSRKPRALFGNVAAHRNTKGLQLTNWATEYGIPFAQKWDSDKAGTILEEEVGDRCISYVFSTNRMPSQSDEIPEYTVNPDLFK